MQDNSSVGKNSRIVILLVLILVIGLVNTLQLLRSDNAQTSNSSNVAQDTEQPQETAETDAESIDPVQQVSGSTCSGGANYDASIGKFKLTLSNPSVILRILDDTYEGGPITSLSIGQCVNDQKNVVDIHPNNEISIIAHPSATSEELRASYEAEVGISFSGQPDIMIGGVTAQVYSYSGLSETKVIYFDNNGIGYEIEVPDDNTTTNTTLNDITSDWSFTP